MSHRIEEPIRYLILFEVKDTTGSVTFVALDSKVQDMVQPTEFKLLSGSGINYIDQTVYIARLTMIKDLGNIGVRLSSRPWEYELSSTSAILFGIISIRRNANTGCRAP
ncbi:hypothetical protein C5167_006042 [Papaver somniferum]|uniref:DUF223 domain-containing protein n=1 Tax=Papaver somniferum TaxID=3469 RepID=A0A4Y7JG63_PAPSO|nr:hypothetical protein C5167_006042 [Papaver somniferum]